MKISVLVVAHNEEKYIAKCIDSLLVQTLVPDEIIIVCHNCSDSTPEIVRSYGAKVKLVEYAGPEGITSARIRAFAEARNEIIACLDGDSSACKNWLKRLVKPLKNSAISGVGGYIQLTGNLRARLISIGFFFLDRFVNKQYKFYFWGANFACRKSDYLKLGGFEKIANLKKSLQLNYTAEDLIFSLSLEKLGKVVFASTAWVWSPAAEIGSFGWEERRKKQNEDRKKIYEYFGLAK